MMLWLLVNMRVDTEDLVGLLSWGQIHPLEEVKFNFSGPGRHLP